MKCRLRIEIEYRADAQKMLAGIIYLLQIPGASVDHPVVIRTWIKDNPLRIGQAIIKEIVMVHFCEKR